MPARHREVAFAHLLCIERLERAAGRGRLAAEAIAIERVTGVAREALCPDVFDPTATSSVLPGNEVVEGGAPTVPGNRRAEMQCVKS